MGEYGLIHSEGIKYLQSGNAIATAWHPAGAPWGRRHGACELL